jgi:hypothetical protein
MSFSWQRDRLYCLPKAGKQASFRGKFELGIRKHREENMGIFKEILKLRNKYICELYPEVCLSR